MEKLRDMNNQQLGIVTALIVGVLGVVGVLAGNTVVGILLLVAELGVIIIMFMNTSMRSNGSKKNDKYRKLFMNLPIGFAQAKIITDHTGTVTGYQMVDANETFGAYFNLDQPDFQDKILGESNIEVLQDINAWFSAYNNSGTKEGDLMDVEITMEKLGKVFNTVMYKSEADHINMVVIDVTEQKETEGKLSKAIDDANAAYKTQAEFLANMSHEIRTPINGILGMIQLTLMADDLQADYRDNLITAKNCADNLLRLINDILDISKLEAGKYKIKEEICDIRAAIEETVAAHVPAATQKAISLDLSFGNNIPKLVKADGQRIQQVLNCMLSNAIKFTSEGGVRVKIAALDDVNEQIRLRMAVADTGIGISDANMGKLFVRFSQVDGSDTRKYGGSGLGLVISKQITELMNGTITVQSKEGIGSTFIAEIPLKVVKAAEVEEEHKELENPAVFSINANGNNARILVAEDEPVNQQVIGKLLGMAGFSYDIAENGEKAIELFKQKSYDAALFDVQMPVMDGIAATQEIRKIEQKEHKKRLPIIAVTARAMFGDKERIIENQLDDYIAKPYNLSTVVDTLNKYISKKDK
ncbi:Signal transduction histidine kinase [Eubacterium ruminantium]|uniref:Circadian input-output histidine kinase CikA n=1 Tax=Eubacterium ruminantium TaxID=42322 RepID=A0A1T4MXG1_9FIRM|nr:ATP-binding protein [Eubacterium ruminantium]SCW50942.1 Signal transduction histidine kinase [Eubacterium ruminantium]SDM69399.1 Signal transduction histidine kinase [Eubacterium ruminantium]SJZ71749.1 Signal transduction histidine kinase [Eubacterium ruminantium]